jgi:thiol-disulfide isomerase/thioredoxin
LPTLDQFEFHHELERLPGDSLVCFSAPGCGSCKMMRRALMELQRSQPDLHIFEVDAQRDIALAREFDIFHLPSLFLFHDGQFHCELQAEPLPGKLLAAIELGLSLEAQEAP